MKRLSNTISDATHRVVMAEQKMISPSYTRAPYTAPRVTVTEPSIQGGDVTHVPETEGGLWTS